MKAYFKNNLYFKAFTKICFLIIVMVLSIKLVYDFILPLAQIPGSLSQIKPHLWLIESILLMYLFFAVAILSGRYWFSLVSTCFLYFVFIIINVVKIKTLGIPLVPIDLTQIDDLIRTKPVYTKYLPFVLGFLIIAAVGIVLFFKHESTKLNFRVIAIIGFISITRLGSFSADHIDNYLREHNINLKKNTHLVRKFTKNGYLNYFSQALFFYSRPSKPKNYNPENIARIYQKYQLQKNTATTNQQQDMPVNIILILAESFVDPADYAWQTTPSLIQNFKSMQMNAAGGKVMVPDFGGKSINTEFELLTGLSNRFTPVESLPFRELVSNNTPGVARSLKELGFTTNIIQAVKLSGFGFEKIYDYIGIDNKLSLVGDEIAKDPTGLYASSQSIAAQITALTDSQDRSFIYAFANSSHMPWKLEHYPDNQIKVHNPHQLESNQLDSLLAFFNALNHVDTLLGDLVSYYESSDEKTVIFFAGDHLPALPALGHLEKINEKKKYTVPAVLWTNYLPSDKQPDFFLSMNFVASHVLEAVGIKTTGFMKFNQILSAEIQLLSHFIKSKSNELNREAPKSYKQLIEDYKVLQYHILMQETVL